MTTIELPWNREIVGNKLVFDSKPSLNRLILTEDSEIRRTGEELDMPKEHHRWLCGIHGQVFAEDSEIRRIG